MVHSLHKDDLEFIELYSPLAQVKILSDLFIDSLKSLKPSRTPEDKLPSPPASPADLLPPDSGLHSLSL